MSRQDLKQSQYYQVDFLASHSVQPGSGEARRMTVTSGRKCLELYRKSGPVGLLARMLLESSHWRSTRCYLTWKASDTPARRSLFRLVPSMPRTEETAVPFWPTPKSSDSKGTGPVGSASQTHDAKKDNLRGVVLNDQIGGQLNPTWVEWLMGFPLGWTDLNV